ncbi:helix-turn-helix protein [Isoptericola sp. CG 20/1183]|uniref:Helix-turn-helix protein n=1 Tax=Isoptericola halotolerans TaxID=300560 RepID=A0ABX5EIZ9_9MICO|nr:MULTISPECIES: helix-turn-helix transcriptional regulator [Isoptericola]PRZ04104.1 helix-turn-helix protein [Isoptericola sp. CG 20/1183]PRZ10071.1 helix-turn-helix protein [Isoptericola halotolerans]
MDRAALAAFLRRRRAAVQPADVGLAPGARRRTAGLRREEVAALAAMSVDYYTRLEQQRGPQPSEQMLAAIARALRLTDDETDYLFRTAGRGTPDRIVCHPHVAPALQRVFDRLQDTPAVIMSCVGEALVANDLAVALFGDHSQARGWERSEFYRWFTDPTSREIYPVADRDRHGRAVVANLRAAVGLVGADSPAGELVRVLQAASPEFVELWERHEVARRYEDHKVLVHPEVGPIELDCQVLFTQDQTQSLLVLTAAPRSADAEKLALLSVVGQQEMTRSR